MHVQEMGRHTKLQVRDVAGRTRLLRSQRALRGQNEGTGRGMECCAMPVVCQEQNRRGGAAQTAASL